MSYIKLLVALVVIMLVTSQPSNAVILNFDDITGTGLQPKLTTYGGITWDTNNWAVFHGLGNTTPHSAANYVFNNHGVNNLGFSFTGIQHFDGAYFTRMVPSSDGFPGPYSVNRLRYHFFDAQMNEFSTSDWFDLSYTPQFFEANTDVYRVVVEHDVDDAFDNSVHGVPEAEWFSMDDLSYNEVGAPPTDPIPEPATLLLTTLGMAGLAARRRWWRMHER